MSSFDADSFYSNYYVSFTSNAPPIGGDEILPGEKPKNVTYIPFRSTQTSHADKASPLPTAASRRVVTTFKERQSNFPVLHEEKKVVDHFMGAKRAFLASHTRKGFLASEVQERTWRTQEKSRQWEYRREMDMLTTNIKLRDDESLRRLNKARPKRGEKFVGSTTGPRQVKSLPREIQNTTYPRSHIFYFGA
ncbi:hypothetical protein TRFO_43296 [Tritrichomonas foetus]|uniref:Uncharacterized protein n=1 Tax=Tritrichomonas foetus TaxID=1144522 RepID=A0A1J4KRD4_9EUKA|nr:hypothetical protein TRFO_43296 [Tritrichomonas foetus]|eukprot:OHT13658.1 hypothetical protein TRFO_43296 [Tritrichomonas foetus]